MATKYINLTGMIKWAQVYEPDEYLGVKRWKLNFYPKDGGDWDKIQKSGLTLKIKEDDDGKYLQFRRPVEKKIGSKMVLFTPPRITGVVNVHYVDSNTREVLKSFDQGTVEGVDRVGEIVLLGNGTKAKIDVCVYDTQVGKGHRLELLQILELVEYEEKVEAPVEDEPEVQALYVEAQVGQPADNEETKPPLPW